MEDQRGFDYRICHLPDFRRSRSRTVLRDEFAGDCNPLQLHDLQSFAYRLLAGTSNAELESGEVHRQLGY